MFNSQYCNNLHDNLFAIDTNKAIVVMLYFQCCHAILTMLSCCTYNVVMLRVLVELHTGHTWGNAGPLPLPALDVV